METKLKKLVLEGFYHEAENVMLSSKYIFLGTFSGDKMQITVALNSYVFHNLKSGF